MSTAEFLTPDNEQIRHQIRGVLDSYTHDWDILSELLQNSVDAIRDKSSGKGHIYIEVNAPNRSIIVQDNGVGLRVSEIARLLRPFGTNKANRPSQIGEKGVGLKFVMFSSSRILISTTGAEGACTAEVTDAAAWLNSTTHNPLLLATDETSGVTQGTKIEVVLSESDHPIFDYSFLELVFLLRTKTACGDTGFIWADQLNADTKFLHVDKAGLSSEKEFECKYLLPIESANQNEFIAIDDFQAWLRESDRTDAEKRRKLLNKIVYAQGKKRQSGREIRYWSCFVPRREFWKVLSIKFGIRYIEDDDQALSIEELFGVGFSGGFNTSTKGMPTGISIEMKPRGSAGYLPNFFIIIDDPSLRFDIGRKSIQGRLLGMLRELAYENFREYINKTRKYMGGAVDPDATGWDKDEVFEEITQLPDLNNSESRFLKRPNSQEATVAAMFFEQIGKGKFPDLSPMISGYKGRYDLYAKWHRRRVVMEFKFDLAGLFRDFSDERKMFDEINAIVIWQVTEDDRTLAARRAMTIDEVQTSTFSTSPVFPGATKTLGLGDVSPISIIELKTLLNA